MSFQQGVSGLNAAYRNLEVIGNNIANANTVGGKSARAEFAGIYAGATVAQGQNTPGMGVQVAAVTQQFSQGSLRTTENPLDMAINGAGFFCVAPSAGGETRYTRDGEFHLDNQGYIVNNSGLRLQGYGVDATTGNTLGVLSPIQLPAQGIAPKVTANAGISLNLDARSAAPTATTPAFSPKDPTSYASSTSETIYDQQGGEHTMTLYFRRTATDNQWEVYATVDGTSVPAASGGTISPAGQLTFLANGQIDAANSGSLAGGTLTAGDLKLDVPFPASTLPAAPSTSTTSAPVTVSFKGSTQFGSVFGVNSVDQDGYAAGQLSGFAVQDDGTVQAQYSNGKTLPAAKVALANFRNVNGLVPDDGNTWRATPTSGAAAVGVPGSASLGTLKGGTLEESNVDLTQQLVDMITAQRSYQANAQTIKTQDQMVQTLINMR